MKPPISYGAAALYAYESFPCVEGAHISSIYSCLVNLETIIEKIIFSKKYFLRKYFKNSVNFDFFEKIVKNCN